MAERPEREAPYHPMIRDLPSTERPRERLRDQGAGSLSNAELLAIVLRTGTASESAVALATRLLSRFQGLPGLARATYRELCNIKGLGEAKAAQVLGALELGRRMSAARGDDRVTVQSPVDVVNLVGSEMALLEQEHLRALLLNTRNQVMSIAEVSRGSVNSSQVRVAEVFRDAVRANVPSIIVVHNHPSGDPTPSNEDVQVTKLLVEAGKLLDIEVLDHVIVAQNGHASLREKGLGFG